MIREELSRLLAGELDPASEAALRERIAEDPGVAAAWERMNALPDLLAALPIEAPPPALLAKLHAMTPAVTEDMLRTDALDDAFAELAARAPAYERYDELPFAPDPREDTIDPEPIVRPGAPVRLSAKPRTVTRSPAKPAVAARPWRAAGVAVGIAAALAVGVGVGFAARDADDAPARLSLAAGESVVDGDVDVRAGDLDLHVDGRARITVTPPGARADADAASLVVVHGAVAETVGTARTRAAPTVVAAPQVARGSVERGGAAAPAPVRYSGVASVGRAAAESGAGTVTVEVERGDAVVRAAGVDVRVAAGQTRTFPPGGAPEVVPAPRGPDPAAAEPTGPRPPEVRVDQAVARRDLPFDGADVLSRVLAVLETTPTEWPTDLAEPWLADGVAARLLEVEALVADATLADLDCDEYPCVAVYVATGAGPLAEDSLHAALREVFPSRTAFLQVAEGLDGHAFAVAVGPVEAPAGHLRLDRRLHDALRDTPEKPR